MPELISVIAFCAVGGVALLDDLRDPAAGADDAAVTERPRKIGGDDGGGGGGLLVRREQRLQRIDASAAARRRTAARPCRSSRPAAAASAAARGRCRAAAPAPTNCRLVPFGRATLDFVGAMADDHRDAGRLQAAAVLSTRSMMVRPPIRCRTLGSWDFIRVPLPAARTTTWMSLTRGESKPLFSLKPSRAHPNLVV